MQYLLTQEEYDKLQSKAAQAESMTPKQLDAEHDAVLTRLQIFFMNIDLFERMQASIYPGFRERFIHGLINAVRDRKPKS